MTFLITLLSASSCLKASLCLRELHTNNGEMVWVLDYIHGALLTALMEM